MNYLIDRVKKTTEQFNHRKHLVILLITVLLTVLVTSIREHTTATSPLKSNQSIEEFRADESKQLQIDSENGVIRLPAATKEDDQVQQFAKVVQRRKSHYNQVSKALKNPTNENESSDDYIVNDQDQKMRIRSDRHAFKSNDPAKSNSDSNLPTGFSLIQSPPTQGITGIYDPKSLYIVRGNFGHSDLVITGALVVKFVNWKSQEPLIDQFDIGLKYEAPTINTRIYQSKKGQNIFELAKKLRTSANVAAVEIEALGEEVKEQ